MVLGKRHLALWLRGPFGPPSIASIQWGEYMQLYVLIGYWDRSEAVEGTFATRDAAIAHFRSRCRTEWGYDWMAVARYEVGKKPVTVWEDDTALGY